MLKKTIIAFSVLIIFGYIMFLCLFLNSVRYFTSYYPDLCMQVNGSKKGLKSLEYINLAIGNPSVPVSSSLAIFKDFALVMNNAPYSFNSLTTETLASLGFTPWVSEVNTYGARLGQEPGEMIFVFSKGILVSFHMAESWSGYPSASISYRGSPAEAFPMTQKQVEFLFGKPDRIDSYMVRDMLRAFREIID